MTTLLLIIVAILLFPVTIIALIGKICWNYLDSTLFHIHPVTFWQAWAIVFLLSLIGYTLRKV